MGILRPAVRCFSVLWSILHRLLCFLHVKHNRKNSGSLLPLHNSPRVLPNDIKLPVPTNDEVELESWEMWDTENRLSEQSKSQNQFINNGFNSNKMSGKRETEELEDIDYFQELQLEPEIKKTQKIIVRKKDEHQVTSNRLAMMTDIPLTSDLGTLEDAECGGWSDETAEDISADAIKDKRRMEREKRLLEHQQRKLERDQLRIKKDRASALGKLS